jgi:hypothetical protein
MVIYGSNNMNSSMKNLKVLVLGLTLACMVSGIAYADINDGLVAYWPFNGNANDESGNGHIRLSG